MSHPWWSLPHLLTSHVPQHAALPGPLDLLKEDTVQLVVSAYQKHQQTQSGRIAALKNHAHTLTMSAGNLRNNTPTQEKIPVLYLTGRRFKLFTSVLSKVIRERVLWIRLCCTPCSFPTASLNYHVGSVFNLHSITQSRLNAGGATHGRDRETVFCTAVDPMNLD